MRRRMTTAGPIIQSLRFNVLPTDTSMSLGANISSTDEKMAALTEHGAEAVRRTFQRHRLGERDSDRRELEKPHRRLQAQW